MRHGMLWRGLEDCFFCDIAGERVSPFSPGVVIEPRTAPLMEVRHPFHVVKLPRPRTKVLSFRFVVTDQFDNRHSKHVRLRRFWGPLTTPAGGPLPDRAGDR
jgi:hypothetical protein